MNTPICDFVNAYREKHILRLHMPGHKGQPFLGMESMDITEIAGADELYHARGVIRQSEENAAALFGAGKTVYSTEGSSLCIRAMVYLALLRARTRGWPPLLLAGRNAHKTFLSAAALMDAQVTWLYPERAESLIACEITAPALESALTALPQPPAAVYVTSPDYLGNIADIPSLSAVCRRWGVPLLVDSAHGAYLKFLPEDRHPLSLGADLCCDSAHKTLPVLTGGAYLHIAPGSDPVFSENAERAMALFASTSPSYLILQSLDRCNAYLAQGFRDGLARLTQRTEKMKAALARHGFSLIGGEPAKLTLAPKSYGYTGDEIHDALRTQGMECEFSDPDYITMMLTPQLDFGELDRLQQVLLALPRKSPAPSLPPPPPRLTQALSIRRAMLSPAREMDIQEAGGRILADAQVGCPPCIPIAACGERIDGDALRCFRYYGVDRVRVVDE